MVFFLGKVFTLELPFCRGPYKKDTTIYCFGSMVFLSVVGIKHHNAVARTELYKRLGHTPNP